MEMLKKIFKGKKVGFYLMMLDAILALIFGILFLATYKTSMANNAVPHTPEVIGICALLCFVIEVVALAMPEHKWIHLGALLAMCFSFMKQIYLFPNLIADQINHVEFQGGNFPLNCVYTVMQIAIITIAIVASFKDVTEKEEPIKFNKPNIIRYSIGALAIIIATSASGATIASCKARNNSYNDNALGFKIDVEKEFGDVVTDYPYDPASVKFSKANNPWAKKTTGEIEKAVGTNRSERSDNDRFIVYQFEGFYAEGYQGNYSKTYGYLSLWDDGLYNGVQDNKNIFGYWYNIEEDGSDCLVMIDNRGTNANMMCVKSNSKFYEWTADIKLDFSWGTRSLKVNGFLYTPAIGMYIDTGTDELTYEYGDEIDTTKWTAMQVRNDLRVGAVFDPDKTIKWSIPNTKKYPGKQIVRANWDTFTWDTKVTIGVDEGTYVLDASNEAVKKTYRFVDGLDTSGILVKRITETKEEILDTSLLKSELDLVNKKVNVIMPNKTVQSYDITLDDSEASNTITGKIGEVETKYIVKSLDTMKVVSGDKTVDVKIELTGSSKLKAIVIGEKISGDDDLFNSLPSKISMVEKDGNLVIPEKRYFTSTTKANPYSQDGNTYFIFDLANEKVDVMWTFTYQGPQTQEMQCTYTLSGDLADGVRVTLQSCIKETNGQWQWSSNKSFTITECSVDDLPFAPVF